jgi:TonB family protein
MVNHLLMLAAIATLCLVWVAPVQGEMAGFFISCIFGDSAFEQGSTDVKPEIIEKVNPKYPEEAKKEGVQGKVIVEATLGTDGKVAKVKVVNEADPRLAQAALDAVKQWRFKPMQKDGKPVEVKTTVTLSFRLN